MDLGNRLCDNFMLWLAHSRFMTDYDSDSAIQFSRVYDQFYAIYEIQGYLQCEFCTLVE